MKKKKALIKDSTSWLVITISILFVAIIPLLIRITAVTYPMDQFSWYPNETQFYDIYALIKSNAILIIGIVSLFTFAFRQYKYKSLIIRDPIVIITIIFALTIIVSHITSINPLVSSRGYLERYESTWVWLSYLSTFLLIYSFSWKEEQLKLFIKAFVISNVILSTIGIFQYFGIDLVLNNFTRSFITALNMSNVDFTTEYAINYKVIVQTLYHYNYVGFYISLSFPIILSLFIKEQSIKLKLFYGVLSASVLLNLLGSSARGGLVGIAAAIPFIIFFNRKTLFKNLKLSISVVLILIIVFIGFESYSDNFVTKRLTSIFTSVSAPELISNIEIHDDTIAIDLNGNIFEIEIVTHENSLWQMNYRFNGSEISETEFNNREHVVFKEPELKQVSNYIVKMDDGTELIAFDLYGSTWYFGYDNNELRYMNPFGNFDKLQKADSIGFEDKERLGSSRGYIWSRSIPLIIDKPFIGYGPDTFALAFPQYDYVGKFKAYNTNNMIVDKAHNMYINIAINCGLIALISYLALFSMFVIYTFKYSKLNNEYTRFITTMIFVSLISYSVASIFNDSSVLVSPVYWGFLGIGLSLASRKAE
ncbi:MAG: O-antigen ligase family protein [Bacillota bacterium]|nr:O-antigen ligase family protein [Bacillota bacterium]